ncbi:MAG: Pantothenate synthetase [Wolbachia endosymbiont of Ctenocephalides orientis wCori]|nr:MAG: Pantothenate synthetase [Wolbachia endosymbiont of Ctenocephalides orientis wCori]
MLKVFKAVKEWTTFRKSSLSNMKSIGFVPTMGCLHDGHSSLIKRSVSENDFSVLSIFVNKTQFPEKSGYENYPRTIQEDLEIAEREKVDAVILPADDEMYQDGFHFKVIEDNISLVREGMYRPGHFTGMLTVVLKLLTIVEPNKAYFSEKDYQQYELISGMKEAFFINAEIIPCPIIRDKNGVALSSRNRNLSKKQMDLAKHFPLLLSSKQFSPKQISIKLEELGFKVNYIEEVNGRRYGSVKIGETILIDNFLV